jgi:hypothetical protein
MLFTTPQPQISNLFSMTPDVLFLVSLANSDNSAITGALYQVATQEFGHSFEGCPADFPFHHPNAVRRKASNDAAMAIVNFIPVIQEPVADKWWNATLLGACCGVVCISCIHGRFLYKH